MARRKKKPAFYLRKSFNYDDWWVICQVSNNVVVAECPERHIADLLLEYLNSLPASLVGRLKI